MKKIIIIINLVMIFGLIGCGNNSNESLNNQPISESTDTNSNSNTTKETISNNNKASVNNKINSTIKSNNQNEESKKQEYKAKLDKINLGFKEANNVSETTNDMYQEAFTEQKQWDDLLNEIYGVLKMQLSENDMKKLQSEEIQWIKDRDDKAKKDSLEMAGGTMEKVLFMGSLANSTKERCYELVDNYMK